MTSVVDRHLAAQCVDLAHDLALRLTADSRVAAHLGNRIDVAGQKQGGGAHPRGGQCGLDAGMAGAADDDIEGREWGGHGWSSS